MSSRRRSLSRSSIKSLPMTATPISPSAAVSASSTCSKLNNAERHSAVVLQEVAASLNNNAVRMFYEKQYEDALILYEQSLGLLNNANSMLHSSTEESIQRNGTFFTRKFSEVQDLHQPIEIPLNQTHLADVLMSNEVFVSAAVIYNLFVLLKACGRHEDAGRFLELVYSIVQPDISDKGVEELNEQKRHPSLLVALQYHLGMFALECGEKESAWQLFIEAITIGKHHLPHHMFYAKLCTHVGGLLMEEHHFVQALAAFEEAATVYQRSCYSPGEDGDGGKLLPDDAFAAAAA